jgi:hypothetical protein
MGIPSEHHPALIHVGRSIRIIQLFKPVLAHARTKHDWEDLLAAAFAAAAAHCNLLGL